MEWKRLKVETFKQKEYEIGINKICFILVLTLLNLNFSLNISSWLMFKKISLLSIKYEKCIISFFLNDNMIII